MRDEKAHPSSLIPHPSGRRGAMVKDDQVTKGGSEPTAAGAGPSSRGVKGRTAVLLAAGAGLLTGLAVMASFVAHRLLYCEETPQKDDNGAGPLLFRDWPKPDFVLMLTGEQHGYVLPCGCSSPQYGGLERRYNFLQTLKEKGW